MTPRKLFNAQGFPPDYVIEGVWREEWGRRVGLGAVCQGFAGQLLRQLGLPADRSRHHRGKLPASGGRGNQQGGVMGRHEPAFAPRLLPAPEAAHYLGISETMLKNLGLPRRKLGGKRLYDRLPLDDYASGLPVEGEELEGINTCDEMVLAEAGAPSHQIAAWTGHESLSGVQRYSKAADRKRILSDQEQKMETVSAPDGNRDVKA